MSDQARSFLASSRSVPASSATPQTTALLKMRDDWPCSRDIVSISVCEPGSAERAVGSHDGEHERRAVGDVSGLVGEEDPLDAVTLAELVSDGGTHLLVDAWSSDARAPVGQELVQIRLELEAVAPLLAVEVVASVAEGFEALVDAGEVDTGLADGEADLGERSLAPSAVRRSTRRRSSSPPYDGAAPS